MSDLSLSERSVRDLVRVGTQELRHRYMGSCPDYTQPESRDQLCAACKTLMKVEASLRGRYGE